MQQKIILLDYISYYRDSNAIILHISCQKNIKNT